MTFDEVMQRYDGKWEDGRAVIRDHGGYVWTIATGTAAEYTLTRDGQRYVTEVKAARRSRRASEPVADGDD